MVMASLTKILFFGLILFHFWTSGEGNCSTDTKVTDKCPRFRFGNNCNMTCNCDNAAEECDHSSGCCSSGCPWGFTATNCSVRLAGLTEAPTSLWETSSIIKICFRQWSPGSEGLGPVTAYNIRHQVFGSPIYITNGPVQHASHDEFGSYTIRDLLPDTLYEVFVIPLIEIREPGFKSPSVFIKTRKNDTNFVPEVTRTCGVTSSTFRPTGNGTPENDEGSGNAKNKTEEGMEVKKLTIIAYCLGAALAVAVIIIIILLIVCCRKNPRVTMKEYAPDDGHVSYNTDINGPYESIQERLPKPDRRVSVDSEGYQISQT